MDIASMVIVAAALMTLGPLTLSLPPAGWAGMGMTPCATATATRKGHGQRIMPPLWTTAGRGGGRVLDGRGSVMKLVAMTVAAVTLMVV